MEKLDIFTLKNNLKVALIDTNTGFLSFHLRGFVGSNFENSNELGAAHLLEHLLISQNNKKLLQKNAEIYGFSFRDTTLFHLKVLEQDKELALNFISDLFRPLDLYPELLNSNKNLVINELRQILDNPERLIGKIHTFNLMYPQTRLAKFNFGDEPDILKLDDQMLNNYHSTFYIPSNFGLVICGNIKNIKKDINKLLNMPATQVPTALPKFIPNEKFVAQSLKNPNLSKVYVKIDWPSNKISEKERFSTQVLAVLLNKALVDNLRSKGIVYNITTNLISEYTFGVFGIYFDTTPENLNKCLLEIKKTIKNLDLGKFSDVKDFITTRAIFNSDSIVNRGEFYSRTLLYDIKHTYIKEIQQYKDVTLKDLEIEYDRLQNIKAKITGIGNIDVKELFEFDK